MYALFNAGTDFEGRKVVEKRALFFPKQARDGDGFEVRVFRAKARRREVVRYEALDQAGHSACKCVNLRKNGQLEANESSLTTIGHVKKGEKQRMYTYALIDAKDEPFVTFQHVFGGQGKPLLVGMTTRANEVRHRPRRLQSITHSWRERRAI